MLWHSLNENGEINYYDVEWPDGRIEKDIPTQLLEGVAKTEHGGQDESDINEKHGVNGHKENSHMNERKYKQRIYEKKKLSSKQLKIAKLEKPYDEFDEKDLRALRMGKKIDEELDDFVEQLDERKKRKKKRKKRKKRKKVRTKPTPGETRYRAQKYSAPAKSKRAKGLARAAAAYRRGDVKAAARIRDRMEKGERKKKTFRNVPRSDTKVAEMKRLDRDTLKELIEEITQFEMLENFMIEMDVLEDVDELMINERKKRRKKRKKSKKKKGGGLSAAVKKSLDKKADRRCLTRGSVYSEFRKGLAAYLSSGSRKGMSAHQWAHARVNSANPSKSWASVKKRKVCPKKKKKK